MESQGTSSSSHNIDSQNQWKAEQAIAGNAEALQALRELITFPLYYSREAQKLGLKVTTTQSIFHPLSDGYLVTCFNFVLIGSWVCFQWPRGLLLYGPPGTGKVFCFDLPYFLLYVSFNLICPKEKKFACVFLYGEVWGMFSSCFAIIGFGVKWMRARAL